MTIAFVHNLRLLLVAARLLIPSPFLVGTLFSLLCVKYFSPSGMLLKSSLLISKAQLILCSMMTVRSHENQSCSCHRKACREYRTKATTMVYKQSQESEFPSTVNTVCTYN